jgi:hypothetical protein
VLALTLTMFVAANPQAADAVPTSAGTDFWVAFTQNDSSGAILTLFISSGSSTSGTVSPNGGSAIPFSVTPGHVTSVPIPTSYELASNDGIENKGIHITAHAPISVYGLNDITATTDAFLALPTSSEGTRYRSLGYSGGVGGGLAAVATANGTTLTVTPTETIGSHTANVPFTEHLNAGQTYELKGNDLSGSLIASNLPISVYGFNACTDIPAASSACDTVMEQMPPTSSYGTEFVSERLALRHQGDTYRVLADQDGTVVKVNGASVATLNAGHFYEAMLPTGETTANNDGLEITTSKPALVAQYSNGQSLDNVGSDPMEMLIPPFEQFENSYTVATPTGVEAFSPNYINVVVPSKNVTTLKVDGASVNASLFKVIGTSGFSGAQLSVKVGSHTLTDTANFGAFVYGYAQYNSYGYPAGYTLSPVAAVSKLTLDKSAYSAATGANICPIATVKDSSGTPLAGVTVTFKVDKPTAVTMTAATNSAGQATVCFASTVAGTGTLTASAGVQASLLTATASVTWGAVPATTAPQAVQATPAFTG